MNSDRDFNIASNSGGGSGNLGVIKKQKFISNNQTDFIVTDFVLNDNYVIFLDGVLQSFGHSRNGNTIIFDYIIPVGTEVIVMN